jgi:hypothetical protein
MSPPAESGPMVAERPPPAPASVPAAGSANPDAWGRIVRSAAASPIIRAILTNATLVALTSDTATLACPPRFASGARQRAAEIAAVFEKELGRKVRVEVRDPETPAGAGADGPATTGAEEGGGTGERAEGGTGRQAIDDPLVKLAIELFSARIVAVQPRPE